jgi:hypothetical protein
MRAKLANKTINPKGIIKTGKSTYGRPVLRILGSVAALTSGGSGTKKDGRNISKKN